MLIRNVLGKLLETIEKKPNWPIYYIFGGIARWEIRRTKAIFDKIEYAYLLDDFSWKQIAKFVDYMENIYEE